MYDWKKLVRERLGSMRLAPAQQEEIVTELAAHLEDLYDQQLAAGITSPQALRHILAQDDTWHLLARDIERAKRKQQMVNSRTRQIWIPGLLSLFISLAWMIALQMAASWLRLSAKYPGISLLAYALWLVSLPFIGGASAYLSRRAGGAFTTRISVAAFPSIAMALVWLLVLMVVAVRGQPFETIGFGHGFLHAVVIPAIALLIGTLPFFRSNKLDDSSLLSR